MAFKKLRKFLKRVAIIPATRTLTAFLSCLPPIAFRSRSRSQLSLSPTPSYTKMTVTEETTFYPDTHHDYSWARRLCGEPERLVFVFDRTSSTPETFAALPRLAELFRGVAVRPTSQGEEVEVFCAESDRWIGRSNWAALGAIVTQFWDLKQDGDGTELRVRCLAKNGVKGAMLDTITAEEEPAMSSLRRRRISREGKMSRRIRAPSSTGSDGNDKDEDTMKRLHGSRQ